MMKSIEVCATCACVLVFGCVPRKTMVRADPVQLPGQDVIYKNGMPIIISKAKGRISAVLSPGPPLAYRAPPLAYRAPRLAERGGSRLNSAAQGSVMTDVEPGELGERKRSAVGSRR